jgi:beta-N-acetylhexosaminidase
LIVNSLHSLGQKLLLAFHGKQSSPEIVKAIWEYRPAGLTLFRTLNVDTPAQVHQLTESLQRIALESGIPPLLIAVDQEGGQLNTIGGNSTPLPGNMALGAAGSEDLALKAGIVAGRELAAMGVHVNYAPVCDVNINPLNPVIGIRSFGEKPEKVARLASALITGMQAEGVAATAKHFPGHGDTSGDSHHNLPSVPHSLTRLQKVEFVPFRAAIEAGVKMVMSAHLALPAVDGPNPPPATLSSKILMGLLREQLGFRGVIVSDAMDMKAIRQGTNLGEDCVRAALAGIDLLLLTSNPDDQHLVHATLVAALQSGLLPPKATSSSIERILSLKHWVAEQTEPDMNVVGCGEHRAIANEIAERSITLVRDESGLLPLHLQPDQRIAMILPQPVDLTPADTSSLVAPGLAASLRAHHPNVDEFLIPHNPTIKDISEILQQAKKYPLIILGTINACSSSGQADLANEILKQHIPTVIVAMRLPYDLTAFPEAPIYICTYSILEPSMQALAKALFGKIKFQGRLPVSILGSFDAGHGIVK